MWLRTIAVLLAACTVFSVTANSKRLSSWPELWMHLNNFNHESSDPTLTQLTAKLGETTLLEFLKKAGLDTALDGAGHFTLFAPNNEAFGNLDPEIVDILTKNTTALASVLKYHVLGQTVLSNQLTNDLQAETLNGEKVRANIYNQNENKIITINGAKVLRPDNSASNGVLHEINKVLLPPVGDLVATVQKMKFTTLVKAVTTAMLVPTLQGPGPFTLFAPTNEAFEKIPAEDLNKLLSNITALTNLLKYHVVGATAYSAGLTDGETVPTLNGQSVTISVTDDGVKVNDAEVEIPDVPVTNGVIHVIDTVLMPTQITGQDMRFQSFRKWRRFDRL